MTTESGNTEPKKSRRTLIVVIAVAVVAVVAATALTFSMLSSNATCSPREPIQNPEGLAAALTSELGEMTDRDGVARDVAVVNKFGSTTDVQYEIDSFAGRASFTEAAWDDLETVLCVLRDAKWVKQLDLYGNTEVLLPGDDTPMRLSAMSVFIDAETLATILSEDLTGQELREVVELYIAEEIN